MRTVIGEVVGDRAASAGEPVEDISKAGLERDLRRLRRRFDGLPVRSVVRAKRALTPAIHALAMRVVEEALRNVRKHAVPADVAVTIDVLEGCAAVEVINDGAARHEPSLVAARPGAGVGLRMLAAEAAVHGARLTIDAPGAGLWRVRLLTTFGGEM